MKISLLATHLFNEPVMLSEGKFDTLMNVYLSRSGVEIDMSGVVNKGESATFITPRGSAIIPVSGTLTHRPTGLNAMSGACSYSGIDAKLDEALANPNVSTIILDINSHGGMVAGAFDQAERIYAARKEKQIIAIVNEAAYSAAFLMASAAHKIIVPRTGGVGSIGVIAQHVDRSEANAKAGIKVTPVFAGEKKTDLSPNQPLSDEAHERLQSSVNESYELFVDTVARFRGMETQLIKDTQAGLYVGAKAVEIGLADEVNSAKAALAALLPRSVQSNKRIGRRAKAITLNH
ncbi:S49 family peptidase [Shewanella surugensis]|uniref:S49 family peptidase n=1 Tax=Shewanella surugensis TaxID=212020 RepID=A0ABT0LG91_9GAMM|nr:S49 family peptidase [Shewanella surugensis]MCL1126716.1 S49 family peptidase [Shewanella surugensis]